jgi:hypothetical protein
VGTPNPAMALLAGEILYQLRSALVKLRGENFQVIRRWEGRTELQFDVEWLFQIELDAVNRPLARVVARVILSDDWLTLNVTKIYEEIMDDVFRKH